MFYISSRGSSASIWLTRILSKHPKIVCLRASRSFPPVGLGVKQLEKKYKIDEISPDFFINCLLECQRATLNQKTFGSIHGYHGTLAKKACEENNGYFAYITRHPLDRIHSALIYYLDKYYNKDKQFINNRDIHKHICDIFSSTTINNEIKYLDKINSSNELNNINKTKLFVKKILPEALVFKLKKLNEILISKGQLKISRDFKDINSKSEEVFYIYNLMNNLLDSFFVYEQDLIKNCPSSQGIKMEEMISSPEYFQKNIFNKLTPSIDIDKNFLLDIFKEKRYNTHRDNPISSITIWESWPNVLKDLFLKKFYQYEINKSTNIWDYDVSFF